MVFDRDGKGRHRRLIPCVAGKPNQQPPSGGPLTKLKTLHGHILPVSRKQPSLWWADPGGFMIGTLAGPPTTNRAAGRTTVSGGGISKRLGAKHGQQGEAFSILGAGFGGVDHDPKVAARHGEYVAVQGQGSYLWVVDGLAGSLMAADGAG